MDCTDLAADIALATSKAIAVSIDSTSYAFGIVLVLGLICGYLAGHRLADRGDRDDD